MFNKTLLAAAILLSITSVTIANAACCISRLPRTMTCPTPCAPCVNPCCAYPYVGVAVGSIVNSGNNVNQFRGVTGQLFAGYGGMVIPGFYLAGEIFGTPGTARISSSNPVAARTIWDYGASLIPGFMINDKTLGYLRGGATRTRFKDAGVSKTGYHVGVGMQTCICPELDLRGEYVYARYKNVGGTIGNVNVNSDRVNIGIVYKFL